RAVTGAPDFCAQLDPADARELLAVGVVRTFERGQALCYEGQVLDRVLILRSGLVKVTRATDEGREVGLAFRGPGESIGELTALDDRPRGATVRAVEPVGGLALSPRAFPFF